MRFDVCLDEAVVTYHRASVKDQIMGFLLTSKPKLRRYLQIEVVIDFACGDDVGFTVQFATSDKFSHQIMR